jgi:hypothetical protein
VYLQTAEELSKAMSHLGALAQADLTTANPTEGVKGFFAAAAKLQLVAEPKTALLVNQAVGLFGQVIMSLVGSLMPLQKARIDISINHKIYEDIQTEIKRILGDQTKYNETMQNNPPVFEALQKSYQFRQNQSSEYAQREGEAWAQYYKLTIAFSRTLIIEIKRLAEFQIPVWMAIRQDLGLTSDLEEFRNQMLRQLEEMSIKFDSTLQNIEKGMQLQSQDQPGHVSGDTSGA